MWVWCRCCTGKCRCRAEGIVGLERCGKDTAVSSSTLVRKEVKCRWLSVQPYSVFFIWLMFSFSLISSSLPAPYLSRDIFILDTVLPSSSSQNSHLLLHIQRMGPVSPCLRRCLWVGSCGAPPPRPRTSWPSTPGPGAHRYARDWTARSSSPKIMFVCTLRSPCLAWLSTTQVRPDWCWTGFSSCFSLWYKHSCCFRPQGTWELDKTGDDKIHCRA